MRHLDRDPLSFAAPTEPRTDVTGWSPDLRLVPRPEAWEPAGDGRFARQIEAAALRDLAARAR